MFLASALFEANTYARTLSFPIAILVRATHVIPSATQCVFRIQLKQHLLFGALESSESIH